MKTCIDCKCEKDDEAFIKVRSYKGKDYHTKFCRQCNWLRRKKKGNTPYNISGPDYYIAQGNREKWNAYQRQYAKKRYWANKGKEAPEHDARTQKLI